MNPPPAAVPMLPRRQRWQAWACFFGALALYAFTRFTALEQFPAYFFCDEAVHAVRAQELVDNHFRSPETGELLPTYFPNGFRNNLSLSVYFHGVVSWLAGGHTILSVRAASAAVSLSAAVVLALLLRSAFRLREWWLGTLLLAVTPVWLVHSRTGFEAVLMVSCYAWFLLFYLLYRERDPRWILPAMVAGAGTFYAYANGQGVMALTAPLLFASDARYHWRHRGWAAGGLALAAVLFLPFLRFWHAHPDFLGSQLQDLGSYAAKDGLSWPEKAGKFLLNYLAEFDPRYWFLPDQEKLVRHRAPGYGHFFLWLLPFFALGLGMCLRRWREPRCRVLLVALLAAPFSGALAGLNACRVLAFVLPACAFIALGLDAALARVRAPALAPLARWGTFAGLALSGLTLFGDCLAYGPTAGGDYGLIGTQWGAREMVRDAVPGWLRAYPKAHVRISAEWTNGPDAFVPFFGLPPERVTFHNIVDGIVSGVDPVEPEDLVVIPPWEESVLQRCPQYDGFEPLGRVPRPDGWTGFLVGRLRRPADWAERVAAQRRERARLLPSEIPINGRPATVLHPTLELGVPEEFFDGRPETAPRCFQGIPLVVEIRFPQPRALESVAVHHRERTNFVQRVTATAVGGETVCAREDRGTIAEVDPAVRVPLGGRMIESVRIEVEQQADSWVHVRDIEVNETPAAVTMANGR